MQTLIRVFKRPRYTITAGVIAALTLSGLLLYPNQSLLLMVFGSDATSVWSKFAFFIAMHGTLFTNFTWYSGLYTVLIALLMGVNIALLVFYISRSRSISAVDRTLSLTGIGGFVSGLFGIGCAACGTIIVAGALKLLGIAWLLTYLPLHGAEFGFLGVGLLALTTYTLLKRISDPLVCPI